MAVGVDEAGNDDSVRGVDDRDRIARHLDVRPNLADAAALDQYVRMREVADLPVEGEDDAALEQNAAFTLDVGKLGVGGAGALREGVARQHLRRRAAGREWGARFEKTASRRSAGGTLTSRRRPGPVALLAHRHSSDSQRARLHGASGSAQSAAR